jgi:hypothetical protein
MNKIIEYDIIFASTADELVKRVEYYIKTYGFAPIGNHIVTQYGTYQQTMVKYENPVS